MLLSFVLKNIATEVAPTEITTHAGQLNST